MDGTSGILKPIGTSTSSILQIRPEFTVGFASTDWSHDGVSPVPNGCTWYRCILPARELAKANIQTSVGWLGTNSDGKFSIRDWPLGNVMAPDIVVFKVIMMGAALRAMEKSKSLGQKIVIDIDDFFDGLHHTNLAEKSTNAEQWPDNNREIYKEIIANADALIVSTEFLRDYYKEQQKDKPVYLIRNAIDISRWGKTRPKQSKPVVGWLGAVPWRSQDLEQLSGFIGDYMEKRNLRFHHAGHIPVGKPAHELLGINIARCSASPMVPISKLPSAYSEFNIGIVPLNDIPFNRAKSYIKGLEYAAAGVPFIASALTEYEFLANHDVGRIAKSPAEWVGHMDELLDYQMRLDEAELNREIVAEQFSIQTTARAWRTAFSEIRNL